MKPNIYIDGQAGTTGLQIYDRLATRKDVQLLQIDPARRKDPQARREIMERADLTFFCLPDDAAREAARLAEGLHTRIIDASTAHRVSPGWVYGFPELHGRREEIQATGRVANPGCYATGFIALIRPLIEAGVLPPDYPLTVHALSGYTGGGNKAISQYESEDRPTELDSPRHYALSLAHKHLPEMVGQCCLTREPVFCPIICDFPQGMSVAVPLHLELLNTTVARLRQCYLDYYTGERLIQVAPEREPGFLAANARAGRDDLEISVWGKDTQAVVIARLDNLGKGAAGAAVQNMNLMLGFDQYTGLDLDISGGIL